MMKTRIYVLLPIQILVLLLSPRFGWNIHNYDSTLLSYANTMYVDGDFHIQYGNHKDIIDICYGNLFSKQILITVNDTDVYYMEVEIDGNIFDYEPEMLSYTSTDIVWEDTFGIFCWRCILTIIMTLLCIRLYQYAKSMNCKKCKGIYVGAFSIYLLSLLISLRILF